MGINMKRIVSIIASFWAVMGLLSPVWAFGVDEHGYDFDGGFRQQFPALEVQCLIGEAVGEGFEGMVAVGEVIRNRVKSPRWPNTVEGVVLQPKQFSFFNGKSEWRRQFVQDHYGYWRLAQKAWEQSEFTNMARGANHYFNEAINPSWASSMEFTTQIGQHKFYKD